ncbi:MAG TPA: right-handed parallel beta-helix repeat-containing protein [Anaerolineae bacterium]|jgi:hypothetical protein|nr:right-handed parallel beta-helix repeat-containing protein [Anaerolineae bacterium]
MRTSATTQTSPWRRATGLVLVIGLVAVALAAPVPMLYGAAALTVDLGAAVERYVDGATGTDAGPCADAVAPCATIGYAVGQAGDGDSIRVATGTYVENLEIADKTLSVRGGYVHMGSDWQSGGPETVVDGGGAGRVLFIHGNDSVIEDLTITGGQAPGDQCWGGGVWVSGGNVTIRGSTIRDMISECGGGGAVEVNSDHGPAHLALESTTLSGNGGADGGGALHAWDASVHLRNSIVMSNTADFGGGISFQGPEPLSSNLVIEDSLIAHNQASGHGGALDVSGARVVLTNTLVADNSASAINVLAINYSNVSIVNSSIVDNNPMGAQAILAFDPEVSSLTMVNTIMWNNAYDIQWDGPTDNVSVTYSDIGSGWAGEGNISVDPLFVDPAGGDYHLSQGSPCIDTATDAGAPDHDLDGALRPMDGDGDSTATTDIGAYEAPPPVLGTRYIHGETGSDTSDCRDPLAPCQTIGYGLQQAGPRDELRIGGGTYPENLVIDGKTLLLRGGYAVDSGGFAEGGAETVVDGAHNGRTFYIHDGSTVVLEQMRIRNGVAPEEGCWGAGVNVEGAHVTIRHAYIHDNQAVCTSGMSGGGAGGGLSAQNGAVPATLLVEDSFILDNEAGDHGSVLNSNDATVVFTNVVASGNTYNQLAIGDSDFRMVNSTVVGNQADGLALLDFDTASNISVLNSILWDSGGIGCGNGGGSCEIIYSIVEGGWPGAGNLDADPLFGDPFEGDFSLVPGSPCVDAGTDAGAPDHDLRSEVRPLDGDGDGVATTDMGAFELRLEQLYLPVLLTDTGS